MVPFPGLFNTYLGGGYLGELGSDILYGQRYAEYLIKYNWVDRYTRAIFMEFTLYCANINLVAVGTVAFEFLNMGGIHLKPEIYVSRMYRSLLNEHTIYLACDMLFFIYIAYALLRELRKLNQQRRNYFEPTNMLNMIIVILGIILMGSYALRTISLTSKIAAYIIEPDLFVSFYQNAMFHEIVAYIISFIDFFAIIKFLGFLKFNRNFLILLNTIRQASPILGQFMIYISIHITAFVIFSHLIFGAERYNFSTFQRSLYSMNLLLLGKFDWHDFECRPGLGPLIFMVYCIIMTFILMSIFMIILMDVYACVAMHEDSQDHEYPVVEYLINKIKILMGLAKAPKGICMIDNADKQHDENYNVASTRSKISVTHIKFCLEKLEDVKLPAVGYWLNQYYVEDFLEDFELLFLIVRLFEIAFKSTKAIYACKNFQGKKCSTKMGSSPPKLKCLFCNTLRHSCEIQNFDNRYSSIAAPDYGKESDSCVCQNCGSGNVTKGYIETVSKTVIQGHLETLINLLHGDFYPEWETKRDRGLAPKIQKKRVKFADESI